MSESSSTQDGIAAHLAQARRRRRTLLIGGGVLAVVAIGAAIAIPAIIAGQQTDGAAAGDDLIPLTLGDTAESDYQDAIVKVGREYGLDIDFVNFTDPFLPNDALTEGEVDGNVFQHVAFLSSYNTANDADITPLFSTVITSWGLFAADATSADELPDGARIALPDDPSNFSRALFILQSAGLIEVSDDAGFFPEESDITANPRNIALVRLAHESVQTAYSDPSIDGVVTGVDDLDPSLGLTGEDAIFLEDAQAESSSPYVILVATTADRVDEEAWQLLEQTYRDERVVSAYEEEKRGQASIVEVPVERLRETLATLQGP